MRFTIITPSFQQADWLAAAVASVRDQAGPGLAIEHLVQDAGTPGLRERAVSWGAEVYEQGKWVAGAPPPAPGQFPHYRLAVYLERDQGMYDAINRGLARASGDWLAYLNCDEQYLPGALARIVAWGAQHPDREVVFADALLLDPGGRALAFRRTVLPTRTHLRLCQLNTLTCATFFRRSLVGRGHRFPADRRIIGDAVWVDGLLAAGVPMGYLRQPTSTFTFTGQNLSEIDRGGDSEQARWRAEAGAPARALRLPVAVLHWLRKAAAGAYWRRDLSYATFPCGTPTGGQRDTHRAAGLGHRWPRWGGPVGVVAVAQTPPPVHGQAVMNAILLAGTYRKIRLHHVRMAFSQSIDEVGSARVGKLLHLVALLARLVATRLRSGATVLYYPPASPNRVPFWRDVLLLLPTRWMFRSTVFHFHANGLACLYPRLNRLEQALFRLAYQKPQVAIALSQLGLEDSRFLQARHIEVVPNGIPDANPEGATVAARPTAARQLLFLATVSASKGAGVLLEALALLRAAGTNAHLTVAGPFANAGEERDLRALAGQLGLADQVTWAGPRQGEAKWAAYRAAEVFCFPTHYEAEGFPVVILEAMMWGLPVVATRWRGLPEMVVEGQTGTLVEPRDPAALAAALGSLLADSERLAQWGAAGRQRFRAHYTAEAFQQRMEAVLAAGAEARG